MDRIGNTRASYTLEFKQEAVRLVQAGRSCVSAAKALGIANQTLDSWVRLARDGKLGAVGGKPVTAEQMELSRLRAENTRLKMERDILKKATAYFAREHV